MGSTGRFAMSGLKAKYENYKEEKKNEHTNKLFQKSACCADGGDDGLHHDAKYGVGR